MIISQLKLCLVTHMTHTSFDLYQQFILQAISGGVTAVQLRNKKTSKAHLLDQAFALKELLGPLHIPLIINDDIDIAKAVKADGLHLGQTDCSPQAARDQLGPNIYIGLSIETLDELAIANQLTCINYIGASAVFESKTKTNCKTIWGLEGLKKLTQQSIHPVVAIGGINASNIKQTMACGPCGVAVVSAIHDDPNPKLAAERLT